MIKYCRILVICISLFTSFYFPFSFAGAAPPFLADKHKVADIGCDGCHKENPPKEHVPTLVCNKCHEDQAKVAEKTLKVIPNPHDSHLGNQRCELCHHAHKPSEDHCSNCHEFDYKVP